MEITVTEGVVPAVREKRMGRKARSVPSVGEYGSLVRIAPPRYTYVRDYYARRRAEMD